MLSRRFLAKQFALRYQRFATIIPLTMPALSPTMEKGRIAEWNKKVGDAVESGDAFCQIETDKSTVPFNCNSEEGFLARILIEGGAPAVKVGEPIGLVVEEKEDINSDEVKNWAPAGKSEEEAPAEKNKEPPAAASASAASPTTAKKGSNTDRVFASPLAKKTAKELDVDISQVEGTGGAVGRVTKEDVIRSSKEPKLQTSEAKDAAASAPAARAAPSKPAAAPPSADGAAFTDLPISSMRQTIAKRLSQSKNVEVPHYYITNECVADNMLAVIKKLNEKGNGKYKISVNDYLIKAIARANLLCPACNTHWLGSHMRQFHNVDVCVAVATPQGLLTPIIKNADLKGLAQISNETKSLAAKAREGSLQPHEYQGGTVTISNLGGMGVKNFSAIINPPQSMILAVGITRPRQKIVMGEDGEYQLGDSLESVFECTVSFDHRVVDGAVGAEWWKHFKDSVENPLSLLL